MPPEAQAQARERFWPFVAPILRLVAEAGIFTVIYAALAVTLEGAPPVLGPLEFLVLIGLGAMVRTFSNDQPEIGAILLFVALLAGGLFGWLASADARELFTSAQWGAAFTTHGIGWIGAVAVLRGAFISGLPGDALQMERLLRGFLPLIAVVWAAVTIYAPQELWPDFVGHALWGSLMLIWGGLAGIGLLRVRELHATTRDASVRSLWRQLVIGAAVAVIPLSLPFVVLAGLPLEVVLRPLGGPVQLLVLLLITPIALLVEALIYWLQPLSPGLRALFDQLAAAIQRLDRSDQPSEPGEPSVVVTVIGLLIGALVLFFLVAGIYALARWLISRRPGEVSSRDASEGGIEHDFVVPEPDPPRPRPRSRRRRAAAHDAVTAYVNAVDELSGHTAFARSAVETPAEHSLRLRLAAMPGSTDFSRLAADYQLARYAERPITAREDRRALSRLERFRRALRRA